LWPKAEVAILFLMEVGSLKMIFFQGRREAKEGRVAKERKASDPAPIG
jgi:hypothetical protein